MVGRPDWRTALNARAIEALVARGPHPLPNAVWQHALAQRLVPDSPARAVESYWRAHPLRADRLARALAAASGAPSGWVWRVEPVGVGAGYRAPPAPYREAAHARGPGTCCVCGRSVFRLGWHRDLWGHGPSRRATWHAACVAAWKLWTAPAAQDRLLARLQRRRCALTGAYLRRSAEVDHRVPLYRVWRDERHRPWPELLGYWGLPNLQVISEAAHRAKCEEERRERASRRPAVALAA